MTLDETIKTSEELAELNEEYSRNYKDQGNIMASWSYEEFAKRHRQLVEWLKDYKRLLEQEPCKDAISRSELLKAIDTYDKFGYWGRELIPLVSEDGIKLVPYIHYDDAIKCIKSMPPVQPEQSCREDKMNVLEKIKSEIEQNAYPIIHGVNNHELGMTLYGILQVIDKYMREIEDKEC